MTNRTIILILMGITGFAIWTFMAWQDSSLRADYLKFIIGIVVGVVGLVLRDLPTQPPPPPPTEKEPQA